MGFSDLKLCKIIIFLDFFYKNIVPLLGFNLKGSVFLIEKKKENLL